MTTAALIATADPRIADDLLRLAAAANAEAEVARSAEQARLAWHGPPLVLVGTDLAQELVPGRLRRRPGVVLVTAVPDAPEGYRMALRIGAEDLAALPDDEPWLVDALALAAEPFDGWATTVCVVGGSGGAGASLLSAVLGLTGAARGLRTLLVDGDPLGGGIDLLLGQEHAQGARWPDLAERRGRLSGEVLREALPCVEDLAVLSWHRGDPSPPGGEAMQSILDAATRGFDLIVVDLPRQADEASRIALNAASQTWLVVPAELRATAAADRVRSALLQHTENVRLVVRGPGPGGLTAEPMAQALDLPLAGYVATDRNLPKALECGDLIHTAHRRSLTDLSGHLLNTLDLRPRTPHGKAA
jgi:secretion/DNA translocation related CpaE-like protein